jgi:hypothetical protein
VNHEFWYLSRAAGFTGYLLLFVSVALGISMGTRLVERFVKRNTVFDIHRFTTLLALAFTIFHVYILLLDGYFHFNVWQLSIPFLSPYRTWQTAVGVFSLYALILLIASFYVRRAIGYRTWRALHFLTFAMFASVALHGIVAGTDTTEAWAKAIYVTTGGATIALILYRIQYHMPDSSTVRTLRLASGVATVIVAAVLMFGTSLFHAPGTTPSTNALAEAAPTGSAGPGAPATPLAAAPTPTPAPFPFLQSFDNDFAGTYAQTKDASASHLTIDGTTTGDFPTKVRVELTQSRLVPTPDNEVDEHEANDNETTEAQPKSTITVNTAQLMDPATNTVLCKGQLTSLDDGYMRLTCDGVGPYAGVRIAISSRLQAAADGTFTGALSGTMRRA